MTFQVGTMIRIKNTDVIGLVLHKVPDCSIAGKDMWAIYGLTNDRRYEMSPDNPHIEVIGK